MGKRRQGSGGVYRRGRVYWIRYNVNGDQQRESAHTSDKAEARRLLDKRLGERAEGRLIVGADKVTFEDLVEGFLADLKANSRKTLRETQRVIENHLAPYFHGRRASEITTTEVQKYVAYRRDTLKPQQVRKPSGRANPSTAPAATTTLVSTTEQAVEAQLSAYSPAAINKELAALRRMFKLAVQAERIHRMPTIKVLAVQNARQGFFERRDLDKILAKLAETPITPADLRAYPDRLALIPAVQFAYITGWRMRSEVLPLTWSNIDLSAAAPFVRLEPGTTKNGEGRTMFLAGELLALVQAQWTKHLNETPDSAFVFPGREGGQLTRVDRAWRTACEAAGLPGRIMHDFRRTAVRNLVRSGISESVAMKMTGHRTRSVFDRYDIVSEGDLIEAAKKHDRYMRAGSSTESSTMDLPAPEQAPLTH